MAGMNIGLFLHDKGQPDGLMSISFGLSSCKGLSIPRIALSSREAEQDFPKVGVYFLFCEDPDGTEAVYIGESEDIFDRLRQHIRDHQAGREKFYWNSALIFTSSELDKAHIRYVESRLVELARERGKFRVLTKNTYGSSGMKKPQVSMLEDFILDIRAFMGAVHHDIFPSDPHSKILKEDINPVLSRLYPPPRCG